MSEGSGEFENTCDVYGDGNIVKKTLKQGQEEIKPRDDVTVKLEITQGAENLFKDEQLVLSLEKQFVPQGLIDLMCTMKHGEEAEVTVKSAYFKQHFSEYVPEVLTEADVKVDILVKTVQSVLDVYGDGSYYMRVLEKTAESGSSGKTRARIYHKYEINSYGYLDNTEQVPLQVMLKNSDRVPSLWVEIISRLKQGEHARVECNLQHERASMLNNASDPHFNISSHMPSNSTVAYLYIKIASFDTGLFTEGLSTSQRAELSSKLKEEGNSHFKSGNLELAVEQYLSALATLEPVSEDPVLLRSHSTVILGNLSLMHIKLKEFTTAEELASKALEINTNDPKALYRRGVARIGNNKLDAALDDLKSAKRIAAESSNNEMVAAIQKEISFILGEFKKANEAEKAKFKNLFK